MCCNIVDIQILIKGTKSINIGTKFYFDLINNLIVW